MWHWHVISGAVVTLAVAAVLVLVSPGARFAPLLPGPLARPVGPRLTGLLTRRWVRPLAAAGVLVLAISPLLGQLRFSTVVQQRYEALVPHAGDDGGLYRGLTMGDDVASSVEATRANAFATDSSLTVYPFGVFNDGDDRGWRHGVLGGNANLVAGLRPGYGSLAVWPKGVQEHLNADYQSGLSYDQPGLLDIPEGASVPWIDLLSGNRVLLGLNSYVPDRVAEYFEENWTLVYDRQGWKEYARPEAMPGRVTMATRTTVTAVGAEDGIAHAGSAFETYDVSTGHRTGSLVFRTPYWNGLRATLDGEPVEVSAYQGAVLQVRLPAGVTHGRLQISFEPIAARILPACVLAGGALLVVAVLVGARRRVAREDRARA
jgi:hypothetical protein